MSFGLQEFLLFLLVVGVLSVTGLWPRIISALREIRGENGGVGLSSPKDLDLCYRILGLSPSARWDEVERAYKQKAKIHHPDHGGDDDMMRAINEAYDYLKRLRRGKR